MNAECVVVAVDGRVDEGCSGECRCVCRRKMFWWLSMSM